VTTYEVMLEFTKLLNQHGGDTRSLLEDIREDVENRLEELDEEDDEENYDEDDPDEEDDDDDDE
jgi:hypothetical protein